MTLFQMRPCVVGMRLIPFRSLQIALATVAVLSVTASSATAQTHPALAAPQPVQADSASEPYSPALALAAPLLLTAGSTTTLFLGASKHSDTMMSVPLALS